LDEKTTWLDVDIQHVILLAFSYMLSTWETIGAFLNFPILRYQNFSISFFQKKRKLG
jgi:hypothetical protein